MKSLFILLITIVSLEAQSRKDSLVTISDLNFRSQTEKNVFAKLALKANPEAHELFVTSYSDENISSQQVKKKIDDFISVHEKKAAGFSNSAKVKYLYKEVHREFLKVYKLKNSFSDIFEKGEYNCVSASALYAIIFQKCGIPYQIIESPRHVFLIAFPANEKIMIETTMPEKGYFQFSNSYIEKYIKYLYDSKLISKQEYDNNSALELFDKYYFSQSGVSLEELAGLQYSNYALYAEDDHKGELAVDFMRKACFLYEGNRHTYMLKSFLMKELANNNYTNANQIYNLKTLCNYNNLEDKDVGSEIITNEFLRVLQSQLINNSDYDQFQRSYLLIKSALKDTLVKNEISFIYHYELGRLGLINYKSEVYELEQLEAAYRLKPRHANLQNIIFSYLITVLQNQSDPQSTIKTMEKYAAKFSFLNENVKFISVQANCFLELAYQNYSLNNIQKGDFYLLEFEKIMNVQAAEPETKYIEKAYSVGAGAYYKKGNKVKAKEILKRGLKFAPENFGLQQRLSQL